MRPLAEIEDRANRYRAAGEFNEIAALLIASRGDVGLATKMEGRSVRVREGVAGIDALRSRLVEAETTKTAVSAGDTADSTWAAPIAQYQAAQAAFITSLRSVGAFDFMLNAGMKIVPLRHTIAVTTTGINGSTVNQESVKPIGSISLGSKSIAEHKSSAIVAASTELMRLGGSAAATLLGDELRSGLAYATDATMFSLLDAEANVGTEPSSGSTMVAFKTDVALALANMSLGSDSKVYIVMRPVTCRALVLDLTENTAPAFPNLGLQGGELRPGLNVVVSDACPADKMYLLDASQCAANPGTLLLSVLRHGDVQLSDAPDSPNTASTTQVNMWQHGLQALFSERWYGFQLVRSTACRTVTGCDYAGGSP